METHAERRFNLVDENWIPVAGEGLVSLRRVFTDKNLMALGGNPVEKIALTKLLLAIAQTAYTPENDEDWTRLGAKGMAEKAVRYLEEKKDLFWLYGDGPFLQMPAIEKAAKRSCGTGFFPDVPAKNNSILFQCQIDHGLSDSQRAVHLITLMGFALGGKRIGKPIALSNGYSGKTVSAKPGPNLGYAGYLHSYLMGNNLQESIYLNLFSLERIKGFATFVAGVGKPPWEIMPVGENCETAKNLKNSYMGCLIPICRFILFTEDGMHYSEGIQYPNHIAGWREPSIAYNENKKKVEMIWVNPQKKPWRELTALLSFISATSMSRKSFECRQIRDNLPRVSKLGSRNIGIWSGGLRITSNAGDQSVKGNDDYIESEVFFSSEWFEKGIWFTYFKIEMEKLEEIAKVIYGATFGYFKHQKVDGKKQAVMATNLFWQLCERKFQDLVNACGDVTGKESSGMRWIFIDYANRSFNALCPKDTARQMEAWAANRPNLGRFLQGEKND